MRRMAALIAALATIGMLSLAGPLAAQAATGEFRYGSPDGERVLSNPADNQAIGAAGFAFAANDTDRIAMVYRLPLCIGGPAAVLEPGEEIGGIAFACVRFIY